jgi:hypothetical protein
MQIINVELIKQPLNWAIIFLMVVIASIAGHQLLTLAGMEPATNTAA